ncbi:TIGR02253 family HAD-type hydrolase [Thermoproteota archaeon]
MIKAVLFDLDNTLIDFMKMKRKCITAAIDAMIRNGLEMEPEAAEKVLYAIYEKEGIEYNRIFQAFLKEAQQKIDYKMLSAGIVAYRKKQQSLIEVYPNVIPTLIKLKTAGLKLAIVSDAPRLNAWIRLHELNIADFFDTVVAFGDVEERKPSKLPFEKALSVLKIPAEDVLMVGDWPDRDIKGANALGMKTCFAKYGYVLEEEPAHIADFEIDNISELVDIVSR